MRTRHRVAVVLLSTLISPALLPAQDRTEADLVELIVRDSLQARAIRAAADVVVFEQAARLAFPNPAASYTREGAGFTEFVQVEQLLPVFGIRAALARAGVAARLAAEAERDARLWQLRSEARVAVARLRAETARRHAAESTAATVERLIEILRTREREGEGSRFDRVRAEQESAETRHLVILASIAVSEARRALAALLPPDAVLPAAIPAASPGGAVAAAEVNTSTARAIASRAELRALRSAAGRFEIEGDIARRAFRPAPTVLGGVKRADDAGDRETGGVFGVSFTVPLFNSGKRDAARWNAERLRVDAERTRLEGEIRAQVTRASETLALREQAMAALQSTLASADELVSIADVAYREGEIGILELLDAYRTATRARQRAVDLDLERRLAQLALERAVGEALWP